MELPLDYFDEIRASDNVRFETREGSSVVLVNETMRLCHITSLYPTTFVQRTRILGGGLVREASNLLAIKHFNERNPVVVPALDERLKDCNLYFTMEFRDTQISPIVASKQWWQAINVQHSLSTPAPTGLVGAILSVVSVPLAVLGGVREIPQVAPDSISSQLDNREIYPYFARTAPSGDGYAKSLVLHFDSLGVTHFGILYVRDPNGIGYFTEIFREAESRGMTVIGASYVDDDMTSVDSAAAILKESGLRYFMGLFNPENHRAMLDRIYRNGIIGSSEYFWMFGPFMEVVTQQRYRLDAETELGVAKAINGSGLVSLNHVLHPHLVQAIQEFFRDKDRLNYFVSRHAEQDILKSFNLSAIPLRQFLTNLMTYDATMAMGIAACEVEGDFFSGSQLYEQLKRTEFPGATGYVSLDHDTGSRRVETVAYQVINLVSNPPNDEGLISISAQQSVVISNISSSALQQVAPFVYWDGTTTPPIILPVTEEDLNLMGTGVRVTGWILAGIVMLMSVAWFVWTVWNRKKPVVQASQPVFLGMLCVGTLFMASSIIPSSLQEPISNRGLDIACMASVWLFSVGFVTSFSALFSKAWRLNRLFKMSRQLRRGKVGAKDVLIPFLVLLTVNLVILTTWTIVSPLEWTRVETSGVDRFERSTESYGTCYEFDQASQYVFFILLVVVNFLPLVLATYQEYKSRNFPPTSYNESRYIAISLASLLETFLLSIPLFFLVSDSPSADFIVESVFVTIICVAILLPLFVPKFLNRNEPAQTLTFSRRVSVSSRTSSSGRPGLHPSVRDFMSRISFRHGNSSGLQSCSGIQSSSGLQSSSDGGFKSSRSFTRNPDE